MDIYLPLARLLNFYIVATQQLRYGMGRFLGYLSPKVPYVIGIAGSVAVGKSTTARILQALLARWPDHPKVDLVTTDGFLYPNRILVERGLMRRKGFPESYDLRRLVRFVADVKSGRAVVTAPDAGFGVDTNRITILHATGAQEALPLMSKHAVAHAILNRVVPLLRETSGYLSTGRRE